MPVTVDLGLAISSDPTNLGVHRLPLRVRSGGLVVPGRVPGLMCAWVRTNTGGWLGLVEVTLFTSNGRGRLQVRQWCSSRALEKASVQ